MWFRLNISDHWVNSFLDPVSRSLFAHYHICGRTLDFLAKQSFSNSLGVESDAPGYADLAGGPPLP